MNDEREDQSVAASSFQELGQITISLSGRLRLTLYFGGALSLFGFAQREVGTGHLSVFFAGSGGDDDRGFGNQTFVGDIDAVAAGLTQATTDAFVGQHDRREKTRIFDRIACGIDFGADASELDRVIARVMALIDAKLTRLAAGIRQASLQIHFGEPDVTDLLFFQRQGSDRSRRTDLAAGIAARFAAGPIGDDVRSPQAVESLLKTQRAQHVVRTNLETLAAADAHLQEFFFRNAAGRTYRSPRIRVVEIRSRCFPHDGESESAEHS